MERAEGEGGGGVVGGDEMEKRLDFPRGSLHAADVEHLDQERDDEAVTAKLNEVYATESSALDPVLQSIQARSVTNALEVARALKARGRPSPS